MSAPTAQPAMIMPSSSWKGSWVSSSRSLKVPGSPSSALHTTHLWAPGTSRALPPLFAHVVGRAAPALDAVGGQHVGDGVALHGQGLAQRPEAADGFIALQAVRVVLPEIPGDETNRLAHVRSPLVELLEHIQNALLAVQMAVYHAVDPHGGGHVAGPEAGDLLDGKAAVIGHLAHLQI